MDFSHLPDEVILRILSQFTSMPDILLNITSLINKRFQRLSLDASLWRNFTVPDHWGTETVIRFLRLDSPSSHIQTLTCSQLVLQVFFVRPEMGVDLVLPAIRELILQRASTIDRAREHRLLQQIEIIPAREIDYIKAIPQVFPNLDHFLDRSYLFDRSRRAQCVTQLQTLSAALPNTKLQVWGATREMLSSCEAIDRASLHAGDADTMKWMVENVRPEEVRDVHLVTHDNVLSALEPFVELFSPVITKVRLFKIPNNFIRLLTSKCEKLQELNLYSLPTDCLRIIANTCKHLEKLNVTHTVEKLTDSSFPSMTKLRTLILPRVCQEDLPIILKSCPHLSSLCVSAPQTLCNLPVTLCTLSVYQSGTYEYSSPVTGILQQSQQLPRLTKLILDDSALKCTASALEGGKLTKGWSHITTVDLELPEICEKGQKNLVDILKYLGQFGAPLRDITVRDSKEFDLFSDASLQSTSPVQIFETLGAFPCLRSLKHLLHCAANLQSCDLEVLAYTCPLLQTFEVQANAPQEDSSGSLQWIQEILEVLTKFNRLSLFQLSSDMVIFQNPDEVEEKMNALYGPWMGFKVKQGSLPETEITLSQCPPAYRSS